MGAAVKKAKSMNKKNKGKFAHAHILKEYLASQGRSVAKAHRRFKARKKIDMEEIRDAKRSIRRAKKEIARGKYMLAAPKRKAKEAKKKAAKVKARKAKIKAKAKKKEKKTKAVKKA